MILHVFPPVNRSESKICSMLTLVAYCIMPQVSVYWPPYPMHYGICANRLFAILVVTAHQSINGLELPCLLAATLCLYETRVTTVVRSWAIEDKVTSPKKVNWQPPLILKIQYFLDILVKGSSAKMFF